MQVKQLLSQMLLLGLGYNIANAKQGPSSITASGIAPSKLITLSKLFAIGETVENIDILIQSFPQELTNMNIHGLLGLDFLRHFDVNICFSSGFIDIKRIEVDNENSAPKLIVKNMKKRVLIIGWDCAAPELVFEAFKDDMPNTRSLMAEGTYGELESTIPPITVPAWMCMMTSRDPGELGIYGFRNRKDYSYNSLTIANSRAVQVPTLWDILGKAKKKSVVLGSPSHLSRQTLSRVDGHQFPHASP